MIKWLDVITPAWPTVANYIIIGISYFKGLTRANYIDFSTTTNVMRGEVYKVKYVPNSYGGLSAESELVESNIIYSKDLFSKYPNLNQDQFPADSFFFTGFPLVPDLKSVIDNARSTLKGLPFFVYPYTDIEALTYFFNIGLLGMNSESNHNEIIKQVNDGYFVNSELISDRMINELKTKSLNVNLYVFNNSGIIQEIYTPFGYNSEWIKVMDEVINNYSKFPLSPALKPYFERQSEIIAYGTEQSLRNEADANDLKNSLALQVDSEKYRLQQEINTADAAMQTELRSAERDFNAMVVNAALLAGING